jgi:hypothetical protein
MALEKEEIAAAEKMHRFVAGREKHRPSALRSMWIVLPISLSTLSFRDRAHTFGYIYLASLLVMMVAFFFVDRFQRARYERERLIVQALERDHASELPWIPETRLEEQVKEHLAAVQQIQRELAHGRA